LPLQDVLAILVPRLGREYRLEEVGLGRLELEAEVELPHELELLGPWLPLPGHRRHRCGGFRQAGLVLLEVLLDVELPADVARVGRRRVARLVRRRGRGAEAAAEGAPEAAGLVVTAVEELLLHLDAWREVQRQQLPLVEELVPRRCQRLPPRQ